MLLPILAQQNNVFSALFPFIILAALIYFFGIRPVAQQKKKQDALHSSLKVGDDIVTIGAFKATIIDTDDEGYYIRLSEDTTAYILKAGVARKVLKESDLIDEDWEDDETEGQEPATPEGQTNAHTDADDLDVPDTDVPQEDPKA